MPRRSKNTQESAETEGASVTEVAEQPRFEFDFEIEPAPEGYEPDRPSAGRTRTPSFFDGPILEKKDQGWQRTPYTNEDHKRAIIRELTKAKEYHGLGLELNITETHVEWKSRDRLKRQKRNKSGDNGQAENTAVDSQTDGYEAD
jgi:hypothetical protein